MNDVLDKKIEDVLDSADRMFIATSVGGNSSGASVFYARMEKILYSSHLIQLEKLNKSV